jgi:hypothetical protein
MEFCRERFLFPALSFQLRLQHRFEVLGLCRTGESSQLDPILQIARLPICEVIDVASELLRLLLPRVLGEYALNRCDDLLLRGEGICSRLCAGARVLNSARALKEIDYLSHFRSAQLRDGSFEFLNTNDVVTCQSIASVLAQHRVQRVDQSARFDRELLLFLLILAEAIGG